MTTLNIQTKGPFEGLTLPEAGTFEIDPAHTQVGFLARHMMVSKVRGRFGDYTGRIEIAGEPLDSRVEIAIKTGSIDTREEARDNHLRSADFFEAEKYPELSFTSTKVEHLGGNRFAVTGDLTVKGVTRPVTLDAEYEGVVVDPYGNERIGLTVKGEIDRYDFGLTWGAALETGGLVVGRKVLLELEVEALRAA